MDYLAYVFYIYFISGSVSLGYLLMRLTYPEVRTLSHELKLGVAGISGALLAVASLAIDYAYDGSLAVLEGNGVYPIIMFVMFLLSFVALKMYFMFSRPEFLTVGMPIDGQPTITIQIERIERKVEPEVQETIIGKRQGADMRDRGEGRKKEVIEKLRKDDLKMVAEEHVELQKKEDFLSKIVHVFSPKKSPQKVPLDDMSKSRMVPVMKNKPEVKTNATLASEPFEKSGAIAGQSHVDAAKIRESILEKQKSNGESIEGSFGKSSDEQPEKADFAMQGEVSGGNTETEGAKEPARTQGYMAIVGGIIDKEKSGEDGGKAKSMDEEKAADKEGKNAPQSKQLDAGGHERLYLAAKSEQDEKAGVPKGFIKEKFETDPKLKAETLKKVEEAQTEAVLQDILPKEVLVQEVSEPIAEGHRRLYEAVQDKQRKEAIAVAKELPPGAMVHRRYMVKTAQAGEAKGVSVVAAAGIAKNENFDSMVNDVYTQLKSTKSEGIAKGLKVAPPKGTSSKTPQKEELSFEDLIGEKPKDKEDTAGSSDIMAKLSGLTVGATDKATGASRLQPGGTKPTEQTGPKSSISFVKIEAEKGMGCPTCHSKNTKIIFCPYCGSGMCANCSPSIKIKEGGFVYTCPKCKEDVDIRKKSPEGQTGGQGLMGMGSSN
ncbi:MAG: hypothetical protein ABH863_06010 [Candidatus Micrarchaeota archaeon]